MMAKFINKKINLLSCIAPQSSFGLINATPINYYHACKCLIVWALDSYSVSGVLQLSRDEPIRKIADY